MWLRRFGLLLATSLLAVNSYAYGTDACDSSAILLIHANGTPAGTTFSDSDCPGDGVITVTANGNAAITASGKFEQGLTLDGTGDYLQTSTIATTFSGDFTVDMWVNFAANPAAVNVDFYDDNASFTNFSARLQSGTRDLFIGGNEYFTFGTWAPTLGTWYHIAIVRSGTTVTWYTDGVSNGTATDSTSPAVGVMNFSFRVGIGEYFNGQMDEIRVSNKARWTAAFTPPSSQYCSGCEMVGI